MNRTTLSLTVMVALAMTVPAAAAGWMGQGTYEPSTSYDTSGYMWQEAPQAGANRVYFNAYSTNFYLANVNPNVGASESRIMPSPLMSWAAALGVWEDCNGDGYIGLAESAIVEYRAELLDVENPCREPDHRHNTDGIITELLWIAVAEPSTYNEVDEENNRVFVGDPGRLYAPETRVWGDRGEPGQGGSGGCPIAPTPAGTTSNTGRTIKYADCHAGRNVARTLEDIDALAGTNFGFQGCDTRAVDGFQFDSDEAEDEFKENYCRANPHHSDSPLVFSMPVNWRGNPYHEKNGDGSWNRQTGVMEHNSTDPAFRTWDCTEEGGHGHTMQPAAGLVDETVIEGTTLPDPRGGEITTPDITVWDGTGPGFSYSDPAPTLGDDPTGSSYWDGLRYAVEGAPLWSESCEPQHGDDWLGLVRFADDFYVDGNHEEGGYAKDKVDMVFRWWDGLGPTFQRSGPARELTYDLGGIFYDFANEETGGALPAWDETAPDASDTDRTPLDLGIGASRSRFTGVWQSFGSYTVLPPQSVNRDTLEPSGAAVFTFYAHVNLTVIEEQYSFSPKVPGDLYTYGSEGCGEIGDNAPVQNLWVCDPANWTDNEAERYDDGFRRYAKVGDPYHFRDVDCLDGHVAAGLYASLTQLVRTCESV